MLPVWAMLPLFFPFVFFFSVTDDAKEGILLFLLLVLQSAHVLYIGQKYLSDVREDVKKEE